MNADTSSDPARGAGAGRRGALLDALRAATRRVDAAPHLFLVFDLAGPPAVTGLLRALRLAHADIASRVAFQRLSDTVGAEYTIHTVTADCHALVLYGTAPEEGVVLARRVLDAFSEPLACAEVMLPAAAAAGLVPFTGGGPSPEAVLLMGLATAQDAHAVPDRLLQRDGVSDDAYARSLALIDALPAAFTTPGQLWLVYQPRLALSTRLSTRAEALLRWRHPVLGPVGPVEFIPLVEELGLSRVMTAWVIDTALAQVAAWRAAGMRLGVAVNITIHNLEEPDFVARLAEALSAQDMRPEVIELEMTESIPRLTSRQALRTIAELKALGIRLAIDDFGTGYSNLSELRSNDAQIVKIDRSFVKTIGTDTRDSDIVRIIVSLAHRLGYWVVAEGIETSEALEILADLGCDEGQGYFIARPMLAAELPSWLERSAAKARSDWAVPPPCA